MSGLIPLVVRREVDARLRTRAFGITTAVMVVAVVALSVIMSVVNGGGPKHSTVGVLRSESALSAPLAAAGQNVDRKITTTVVTREQGERLVKDGSISALLLPSGDSFRVEVNKSLDATLRGVFTEVAQRQALNTEVSRAGADPATVDSAMARAGNLQVATLHHEKKNHAERLTIGIVIGIVIYMSLMMYGQTVAQGVIEEKSSRVVELLLATMRPWQLMAGKVVGIGIVGTIQVLAIAVAGLVSGDLTGTLKLPGTAAIGAVAWGVVWYVLGFFTYAMLFAAVGAMVSRQEDVNGIAFPVIMPLIAAWVIGISLLPGDPSNGLVTVLSVIPLFSPVLMPMRIALGEGVLWQEGLAVVLTLVLLVVFVRIGGVIYRNSVLRTGARVRLADALRAA